MFDTVKMRMELQLSAAEIATIDWDSTDTNIYHQYGKDTIVYKKYYKGDSQPRLKYSYRQNDPGKSYLTVEVSIPTFLYGDNVSQLKPQDIPVFFSLLQKHIAAAFKVPLNRIQDPGDAVVSKLHTCYNFRVGTSVSTYLAAFSKIERSPYRLDVYGNGTTVSWTAQSRKERMYDKLAEIRSKTNRSGINQNLINRAKGILRYEIELSNYDLKTKSSRRLAKELLDPDFAQEQIEKGLKGIGASKSISVSSLRQLVINIGAHPLLAKQTKTNLIAYVCQAEMLGKQYCDDYYSKSRLSDIRRLLRDNFGINHLVFSNVVLPPLRVRPLLSLILNELPGNWKRRAAYEGLQQITVFALEKAEQFSNALNRYIGGSKSYANLKRIEYLEYAI